MSRRVKLKLFPKVARYVAAVTLHPEVVSMKFYTRVCPFLYRFEIYDEWEADRFGYLYKLYLGYGYPIEMAVARAVAPVGALEAQKVAIIIHTIK